MKKPFIANCSIDGGVRWWWPNGIEEDSKFREKSLYNATVEYHYMSDVQSETKIGFLRLGYLNMILLLKYRSNPIQVIRL